MSIVKTNQYEVISLFEIFDARKRTNQSVPVSLITSLLGPFAHHTTTKT